MKIILFGGSGFVGTNLTKKLKDKSISSIVYDKRKPVLDCEYVKCDVTSLDKPLKNQQADIVINLAAEHRDDVTPISKYYDVNVNGAKNVCEYATSVGAKKIIFTSSVAIYGFAKPNTGEDGEINHFNEYGKTKFLAEKVYKHWQEEDLENRSLVIIRPTVIFGPGAHCKESHFDYAIPPVSVHPGPGGPQPPPGGPGQEKYRPHDCVNKQRLQASGPQRRPRLSAHKHHATHQAKGYRVPAVPIRQAGRPFPLLRVRPGRPSPGAPDNPRDPLLSHVRDPQPRASVVG